MPSGTSGTREQIEIKTICMIVSAGRKISGPLVLLLWSKGLLTTKGEVSLIEHPDSSP